ncbi:hypothetical protein [Clostridium estertheticum]|uniref:hypothetical protein n=1 Tax=Clostridium estertheticum TaxID=238834 RepID=UPI001C6F5283|nr:hypothetical protein [Clostridium estertheticum]MBW9154274.1 hypothetical protein [Clostridium estertheticum]WLC86700.1 hypothetical protein KTC97_22015 [Clostridium estertheticum]
MKHKDLKQGDIVIFKLYDNEDKEESFKDGSVISVYSERKEVSISYLDGYKSRSDDVAFDKVIAKFDTNGEHMVFGNLSGTSILLI